MPWWLPLVGREGSRSDVGWFDESEEKFVARLRARDERAFNHLVRTYERRVFAIVFRMIGRRDEAEDVSQEVFVQIFKAIDGFRGDAKLSTWVYRITVNLCKNRIKYLARRRTEDGGEEDLAGEARDVERAAGATVGETERPDEVVGGRQLEAIVQRAIASLDPEFREALVLRDVEDLAYDEIAEIVGVPEGTVKSRIHRARAQVRETVERALGEKLR